MKTIPGYITIKLHKTKEKEKKIENVQRKIKQYIQKEKMNYHTIYLSETLKLKRQYKKYH